VLPRKSTDFGVVDIDTEVFRQTRTEDDIVEMRAILVTDDGVLWVDTEKFKDERLAEAKAAKPAKDPKWRSIVDAAGHEAKLSRDSGLVSDALEVELPAQLVWLRPRFTLHYGDAVLAAESDVIEGDRIKLRFSGLTSVLAKATLEPDAPPQAADLVCESVFGTFTLQFGPSPGGGWSYLGTKVE
jgi:hypothetical protein